MTACHEPGGNSGKVPRCIRDSEFQVVHERLDGLEERDGEILTEVAAVGAEARGARVVGKQVLEEIIKLRGEMTKAEVDRVRECDLRHFVPPFDKLQAAIPKREELPTIDYDEGDNTKVQTREEITGRAKQAELVASVQTVKVVTLEERVAELQARLEERDRHSERVRAQNQEERDRSLALAKDANEKAVKSSELAVAKWKITATLVVGALMAIAAIGQAIASIFK